MDVPEATLPSGYKGEEQESSGHEPEPAANQRQSTAALANAEPTAPAAIIPNTETPACMILVGVVAVMTVGAVAVAVAWYLLKETLLPTDGICDALYLDSVCRSSPCNPRSQWFPTGTTVDFLLVAKAARIGGNKTRMGLAFDAFASQNLSLFQASDRRKKIVENLWTNYNVSHYASLNVNIRAFSSPARASIVWYSLTLLKANIRSHADIKDDYGVVLGVTGTDMKGFRNKVAELINSAKPDITQLIIISHTSYANYARSPYNSTNFDPKKCLIAPPLIHNHSGHYNETYHTSLNESSRFLKFIRNLTFNDTPVFVSVTLKGTWYTPADPVAQNLALFLKCNAFGQTRDAPPFSLCTTNQAGTYTYDSDTLSESFVNQSMVYSIDMELSLKSKMCAYKEKVKDIRFGLAVYDIDADEKYKACDMIKYNGRYNRLVMLRKLQDFMANYTNRKDCLAVS
ncbi:hypothetical protein HPB51_017296 [Rhipicephalus microplus]|uniref:Uncharacterized protein n=1 Tax=Rhipicephalus microplus TaxID=6941 RepID=A0A9J6EUA5_RHIMP|nr:hypothetical protein HPB51_017296 [Rhipicephalus microplus]